MYPNDILSHCIVSSIPPADLDAKSNEKSPSKRSLWVEDDELEDDEGTEKYYCRCAVNSQRGLFYEFGWESHREAALSGNEEVEGDVWDILVDDAMERRRRGDAKPKGPARPKKRIKKADSEEDKSEAESIQESDGSDGEDEYEGPSDDDEEDEEVGSSDSDSPTPDEDEEDEPRTPSKKRKRPPSKLMRTPSKRTPSNSTTTPRKSTNQRKAVLPTPHSRKAIAVRKQKRKQKPLRIRPPPPLTSHLQLQNLPMDPWLRAMHVLHVGARPDVLPCREEEYARCLRAVEELIEEGSGGCVCEFFSFFFFSISPHRNGIVDSVQRYIWCARDGEDGYRTCHSPRTQAHGGRICAL